MPEISDTEKEQLALDTFSKEFPKALIRELREDDYPGLQQEIKEMAARVGKPIFKIYVVNSNEYGAAYHRHTNSMAFTKGFLQDPEITMAELKAIAGHEIGHSLTEEYNKAAFGVGTALHFMPVINTVLTAYVGFVAAVYCAFGQMENAKNTSMIFAAGILITKASEKASPQLMDLAMKAIKRREELECDAISVALNMLENPHGLINALEIKEITDQHKPSSHHNGLREMQSTHPTLWNRALNIEKLANNPDAVEKLQRKYSMKPAHKSRQF